MSPPGMRAKITSDATIGGQNSALEGFKSALPDSAPKDL
jgi:hypothetical protein